MMSQHVMSVRNLVPSVGNALDQIAWWNFLLIFATCSFIGDIYPSKLWLYVTAGLSVTLALHCLGAALGARFNSEGLSAGLPVIGLFSASLLWLFLQISVPVTHYGHELLFSMDLVSRSEPAWFKPTLSWSVTPDATRMLLLSELVCLLALILMLSMLCTRQRLKQVLLMIAIVGGIHAISAITAKYANASLVDTSQLDGHFSVARGWFINRNHLASFLVLTSVCWMSLMLHRLLRQERSERMIARVLSMRLLAALPSVVVLILTVVAVTLTSSRAGIVSLGGVFFVLVLTILKRKSEGQWRHPLLVAMTLLVVILVGYFGDMVWQRFSEQETLLGERGEQWHATWLLIKQNMLLGYGGNSYATLFQMVREEDGLRQLVYNQAHNDYLHIWFEQGLIGLGLWLAIASVTFYKGITHLRRAQSTLVAATLIASLAVLAAALFQSLVDFNLQILSIRVYFFVIIAIIVSVPSIRHVRSNHRHVDAQSLKQ